MKSANKVLIVVASLLLLANIALVFLVVRGRGHSRRDRSQSGEMIAKAIGLNETQRQAYTEARKAHFRSLRPLYDSMQKCRADYFALAREHSPAADSLSAAYARTMSDLQDTINQRTLAYIRRMRSQFTAEQQHKYDSVVRRMMLRNMGRRDTAGSGE
ncbi:MAG: hypothetical protein RJA57_986 [Bacteroidota bacterium]|jgi:hypothetical protein